MQLTEDGRTLYVATALLHDLDRYWDALLKNGGQAEQCGWLKDRFGLCWQIVPEILAKMSADPDRAKSKRVTDVMLKMVKIDIAKLQAAYDGTKV